MDTRSVDGSARFFDSRAVYLLFVTTTDEKAVVADRIGRELGDMEASPPGFLLVGTLAGRRPGAPVSDGEIVGCPPATKRERMTSAASAAPTPILSPGGDRA